MNILNAMSAREQIDLLRDNGFGAYVDCMLTGQAYDKAGKLKPFRFCRLLGKTPQAVKNDMRIMRQLLDD